MKHLIIGTAGHVDHGKTTLIRALTGTDTDRLAEEKRRGITIDIGFARLALGDLSLGIVDVPGHERFVRNMLAGAGGIDMVLLVVAADEGVMPQTREHLLICETLGVGTGLVALTKSDLADEAWLDLVREDVGELVEGTCLEGAPMVPLSAATGQGLDELRAALARCAERVAPKPVENIAFRMPVDRAFTLKGHGTIVTGSVQSGRIRTGDRLVCYPAGPASRVRSIHVHGAPVETAVAGQRCALNLPELSLETVRRGHVLAPPGLLRPSFLVDCTVSVSAAAAKPLVQRQRLRFHMGAAEVTGRIVLLDGRQLDPGGRTIAQLHLEQQVALVHGDRFVMRTYSPQVTIGGGMVLDPAPPKRRPSQRRSARRRLRRLQALCAGDQRGLYVVQQIEAAGLEGLPKAEVEGHCRTLGLDLAALEADWRRAGHPRRLDTQRHTFYIGRDRYERIAAQLLEAVQRYHRKHPLDPGMPHSRVIQAAPAGSRPEVVEAILGHLQQEGRLHRRAGRLRDADFEVRLTPAQRRAKEALATAFDRGGLAPAPARTIIEGLELAVPPEQVRPLIDQLCDEGRLVRVSDKFTFHRRPLVEALDALRELTAEGRHVSVPEIKTRLGLSRKHMIPLLEFFDAEGATLREGDRRRRGPRFDRLYGRLSRDEPSSPPRRRSTAVR